MLRKFQGKLLLRKCKEFYEKKHQKDTRYFELYVPSVINQYFGPTMILDLGSGQQVRNISADKTGVVCSDISRYAMKVAKNYRPASDFIVLDAQQLPFGNRVFNSVLCKDLLEHLPNDEQCASEIGRVLKDRGTLGVWVPSKLIEKEVIEWGHLRSYSVRELQGLFQDLDLIYAAPNRSWGGKRYCQGMIWLIVRILSILPWQQLAEYQCLRKMFAIDKKEYLLYFYEKRIEKPILKRIPELAMSIIAVFRKSKQRCSCMV